MQGELEGGRKVEAGSVGGRQLSGGGAAGDRCPSSDTLTPGGNAASAHTWHSKELSHPDLHQAGGDVLAEGARALVVAGAGPSRAGHGCEVLIATSSSRGTGVQD